jgi:hypothetical protein
MSEISGRHVPAPECDRPHRSQRQGHQKSQSQILNAADAAGSVADLQVRRLRRLFFLTLDTACTIASLAFGHAWFSVVRKVPGARLRVFVTNPAEVETGLAVPEDLAREIFDAVAPPQTCELEAALRARGARA